MPPSFDSSQQFPTEFAAVLNDIVVRLLTVAVRGQLRLDTLLSFAFSRCSAGWVSATTSDADNALYIESQYPSQLL